jgi:hypothetical protein
MEASPVDEHLDSDPDERLIDDVFEMEHAIDDAIDKNHSDMVRRLTYTAICLD